MIFITLGSQKFQFNRLLKAVDHIATINDFKNVKFFAQTGYSDYEPQNFNFQPFLSRDEFIQDEAVAELVISHGGTGAIIGALKKNKKVIAVPRLAKYGEHVDNHQLQILSVFKQKGMLEVCEDCDNLLESIEVARKSEYTRFQSNNINAIQEIKQYLNHI